MDVIKGWRVKSHLKIPVKGGRDEFSSAGSYVFSLTIQGPNLGKTLASAVSENAQRQRINLIILSASLHISPREKRRKIMITWIVFVALASVSHPFILHLSKHFQVCVAICYLACLYTRINTPSDWKYVKPVFLTVLETVCACHPLVRTHSCSRVSSG